MFRILHLGEAVTMDTVTSIFCGLCLTAIFTGLFGDISVKYTGLLGYSMLFGFYVGFWSNFINQVSVCRFWWLVRGICILSLRQSVLVLENMLVDSITISFCESLFGNCFLKKVSFLRGTKLKQQTEKKLLLFPRYTTTIRSDRNSWSRFERNSSFQWLGAVQIEQETP